MRWRRRSPSCRIRRIRRGARGQAFAHLVEYPRTAALMIATFRDTLEQMGIQPSGVDAASGQPAPSLAEAEREMGLAAEQLELAIDRAEPDRDD